MKKLLVCLCVIFLGVSLARVAESVVLTFDDITTVTGLSPIPAGYGGFNWEKDTPDGATAFRISNITSILDNPLYENTGWLNSLVSNDFVAFNNSGNPAWISSVGGSFDFNGAYFTSAYNSGLNITVEGYLDDELIYSSTVILDTTNPTWFDFDYFEIDELGITPFGGTEVPGIGSPSSEPRLHFAMDNFTFDAQPVPEPTTIVLVGFGLAGIYGVRRKMNRQT